LSSGDVSGLEAVHADVNDGIPDLDTVCRYLETLTALRTIDFEGSGASLHSVGFVSKLDEPEAGI